MTGPAPTAGPGDSEIRAQLERILESPSFARAKRMRSFLRFIVEQTLEGGPESETRLKGLTISTEVFGRDPLEDAQAESQVRVEARRLRDKLAEYYDGPGAGDSVVIEVPKGTYVPSFRPAAPAAVDGAPEPAAPEPASPAPAPARRPLFAHRDLAVASLMLVMALLAAGATALMLDQGGPESVAPEAGAEIAETAAVAAEEPSIAVMPFKLLSDRAEDRYVRDGLTDEIITGLTRHGTLFVVAWDTVQHFQRNDLNIRDLGVRLVLDGSLRRFDDERLRVTARLTDTGSKATLWSHDFDRISSTGDLPEVESQIIGRIVAAVADTFDLKLDPGQTGADRVRLERQESYECYLLALAYARRPNPRDHAATRDCLERTVIDDPGFGKAWAALSFSYLDEVRFGFNRQAPPAEVLERAARTAERGIELAPDSELARRALLNVRWLQGRTADFEQAGEAALEAYPKSSLVLADFGLKLAIGGQWQRGLGLMREAIRLNPAYPAWYRFPFLFNHYLKGRDQEALTHALLLELPDYPWTHLARAAIYGQLQLETEAGAALDHLTALLPDFPENHASYLAQWRFEPALAERLIEGLVKAGMQPLKPS